MGLARCVDSRRGSRELIYQPVAIEHRVRESRSFFLRPHDLPIVSARNQFHLAPRSPPAVYIAWKRGPYSFTDDHLPQVIQQRLINVACAFINQIVRMGNEADQSVSFFDESQLLFP